MPLDAVRLEQARISGGSGGDLPRAKTHGCRVEAWDPREAGDWPENGCTPNGGQARIARQKEIDASIAAKAEFEYLYDKPYPDNSRIRVAGPFTVESLSPHRVVAGDADDSLIDELADPARRLEAISRRWCSTI